MFAPQGVGIVLTNNQGQILLLDHIKHNRLSIPGGKVEKGEDVEVAVLRELFEETGIKSVEIVRTAMEYNQELNVVFHLYAGVTTETPVNKEPTKHRSMQWVSLTEPNLKNNVNEITLAALTHFRLLCS